MNILKRIAAKILAKELAQAHSMAVVPFQTTQQLATLQEENESLKHESWQLASIIRHHENRIKQMAPEKQFVVVAPDGMVLEQQMVYSSNGATRITVKLPLGNPWKQATELAQQLELANLALDRARVVLDENPAARQKFLGLAPQSSGGADV